MSQKYIVAKAVFLNGVLTTDFLYNTPSKRPTIKFDSQGSAVIAVKSDIAASTKTEGECTFANLSIIQISVTDKDIGVAQYTITEV